MRGRLVALFPRLKNCLNRQFSSHLSSIELRSAFLNFYADHGHVLVPSSSVVPPEGDDSLLFVNSGMIQFKPIFLGKADPTSEMVKLRRAANSQRCIRASGKHNDLNDVGRDLHHHTFFEMLGNWSFGDYGKKETCEMAWEFLTSILRIRPDRLYVTYFAGNESIGLPTDEECRNIWLKLGLSPDRIIPAGIQNNFWEMASTGPCGPCSEIHFDRIADRSCARHLVNSNDPSVVEIWNLVFMQYQRVVPDGGLTELPRRHIDCGAGFERLVAIMQEKDSNYDTDVFLPILRAIEEVSNCPPYGGQINSPKDTAYRIVADHLRTIVVAIADGVTPSIVDRGHVLRQLIRRAAMASVRTLGAPRGSLTVLASKSMEELKSIVPQLERMKETVEKVIAKEENRFWKVFESGEPLFKQALIDFPAKNGIISGDVAWRLRNTHGIPLELTVTLAAQRGLQVDIAGFDLLVAQGRELTKAAWKKNKEQAATSR